MASAMASEADTERRGRLGGRPMAPLQGNHNFRVTVPMPKSLNELQKAAVQHFGHKGPTKLFHNGEVHLQHPSHMGRVIHDDVIIVSARKRPTSEVPISTKQAHFVRHSPEERRPPAASPRPATPLRFQGNSTYALDYVRKKAPGQRVQSARPTARDLGRRPEDVTGVSSYTAHYPVHDLSLLSRPARAQTPRDEHPPPKFNGRTSYTADFVRHPLQPTGPRATFDPRPKEDDRVFDGATTYAADFHKHPLDRPATVGAPGDLYPSSPARFQGMSEYTAEYLKRKLQTSTHVHLEPELEPR